MPTNVVQWNISEKCLLIRSVNVGFVSDTLIHEHLVFMLIDIKCHLAKAYWYSRTLIRRLQGHTVARICLKMGSHCVN